MGKIIMEMFKIKNTGLENSSCSQSVICGSMASALPGRRPDRIADSQVPSQTTETETLAGGAQQFMF